MACEAEEPFTGCCGLACSILKLIEKLMRGVVGCLNDKIVILNHLTLGCESRSLGKNPDAFAWKVEDPCFAEANNFVKETSVTRRTNLESL